MVHVIIVHTVSLFYMGPWVKERIKVRDWGGQSFKPPFQIHCLKNFLNNLYHKLKTVESPS